MELPILLLELNGTMMVQLETVVRLISFLL